MTLRALVAVALALAPSIARADAKADATKAFTDFITSLATEKPALSDLEAFLPLYLDRAPVPVATDVKSTLEAPKLKVLRADVSKSGTSVWIVAEVKTKSVKVFDDATKNVTLRASGFLVLDKGAWHVRAADLSRAVEDKPADPNCGNASHQWGLEKAPPKALAATVRMTLTAVDQGKSHAALLSDSKNTLVLGSAPGEQFAGAAAKGVKKWQIRSSGNSDDDANIRALAGIGPDADLMWIAAPISGPAKLCTEYRGFFVLAKEASGWKIVHEHYSSPL
ncbi:MAG TPA: hypothetical protein VFV99_21995 [Kofleriaceae bacterium]|nr:hypothetical protein [Kofleriaceae bacterium]